MNISDAELGRILVKNSYLDADSLALALNRGKERGEPLVRSLIAEDLVTKDLLGQAISEHLNVPYADLNTNVPSAQQVLLLPEEFARKYVCVVFGQTETSLNLATDDPKKDGFADALKLAIQQNPGLKQITEVKVSFSLEEDITPLFKYYRKPLDERIKEILKDEQTMDVSKIMSEIVDDAHAMEVSDIHFDPRQEGVAIRFRIDGLLQDVGSLEHEVYRNILNRVKVLSKMRIDEHYAAQDGAIRYSSENGKDFDLRVSVVPTLYGEKITIRILAQYIESLRLDEIGLSDVHQKLVESSYKKPFGMIIVVGPTGSGKTTTLYSVLNRLIRPEINIMTIEDPVEYRVRGVNQIQVNTETDLTFSKGLRSIVRQDPDAILVGEIRDIETAEISVNAALTGHLLLSTFHANDAATAVPRLLDIGIEPFLLASTLELIIAQRLVRKVCEHCRYSYEVKVTELVKEFPDAAKRFSGKVVTLYKGKGCENCAHTGYSGRTAIFEMINVTQDVKDIIMSNPSSSEIWKLAQKTGARSMFEDGLEKVENGITTLEEVMRVAQAT